MISGKLSRLAAAAQLFGVVNGGLQVQNVLAFDVGLELEEPEADPEQPS